MKSTGIIRRIDELGRIVIPKEIRKTLRIHDGDNLEIFTDDKENIILSKYSSIGKISDSIDSFAKTINKVTKKDVIITDKDKIIKVAGDIKEINEYDILSKEILKVLTMRDGITEKEIESIKITKDYELNNHFYICPIIAQFEAIGLIIIHSKKEEISEENINIIKFVNAFFSKYLDD